MESMGKKPRRRRSFTPEFKAEIVELCPRGPRHGPAGGWESLTATERAVSVLVAVGLTNGAVARRLYISPHTVSTHLRHVFAKLAVPNRAALAAVMHHSIK